MAEHRPTSVAELAAIVSAATRTGERLELRGGGSKAAIGADRPDATIVSMTGFTGILDYDPAELVLTAGAGTPLAQIEAAVAEAGQMLAFDPFDHGPIHGRPAGAATIGGIVAAGVSGSRRVSAGGVRDHLLGFTAVSGRGERFVAGAKVVKNVTGYDLPKLACGSWGRLVALTEVTLKVLPRPRDTATRLLRAETPETARQIMTRAMGSRAAVAAAAYRPATATVALRVEGFGPSVRARLALLDDLCGGGETQRDAAAAALWDDMHTLAPLAGATPLWRLSVPQRAFADILGTFVSDNPCLVDWAGGLVWLGYDGPAEVLRDAVVAAGGHAMLVRADAARWRVTPAFHPQQAALAALEARVRHAFDPAGVFETGRFGTAQEAGRAD